MKRRGISTIVATVLIVLITVAAVTILWAGIYPMIMKITFVEDPSVRFTIDKGEYTGIDSDDCKVSIRVKRESDDADIRAFKVVIGENGNTMEHIFTNVMAPNSAKVYNFYYPGIPPCSPDSIAVVPIYYVDGESIEGVAKDEVEGLVEKVLDTVPVEGVFGYPAASIMPGNLIAYYPFTGNADDFTGNGHDGGISGTPDFSGDFAEFDGGGDFITSSYTAADSLYIPGLKTYSFWALPTQDTANDQILGLNFKIYLIFNSGDLEFSIFNGGWQTRSVAGVVTYDDWHHYAVTYNDATFDVEFYVDGQKIGGTQNFGFPSTGPGLSNFYIGTVAGNDYTGRLDDVMVYDAVLSSDDIKDIFEAGRSE